MRILYDVILLVLLALSSNAALGPKDCENGTKTLQMDELDKIFGNWVLIGAVADYQIGSEILANLSSSHIELLFTPDYKTITYNERNLYHDKCITYFGNMTVPEQTSSDFFMEVDSFIQQEDEVLTVYNDTARVDFYPTCSDCLLMTYSGQPGKFLLNYMRKGKHQNAEELKAAQTVMQEYVECLKYPAAGHFNYDGIAEFCPNKSMVKPDQS